MSATESEAQVLLRWPVSPSILHRMQCLVTLVVALAGCMPEPITGGTAGVLTTDGNPLPDVQLTLYSAASGERVAFAVTGSNGNFELIAPDTRGPLQLHSGSYSITLESVGAPTVLPRKYLGLKSTPLKIHWTEGSPLSVNVPGLKLK